MAGSADSRDAAMRYRLEKEARERGEEPDEPPADTRVYTAAERAAIVENAVQQAIRQGEFDNLPGAGKPIPGLGRSHDPDWWIRRKIQNENLTGLGPPALMLRTEYTELADTVDRLRAENDVREHLEDFNRRVVEARRQLLGGPPVITPTVDVDEWVGGWAQRRDAASAASDPPPPARERRRWFFRSRVRRSG